jgi:hypothetical protein
MSGYKLEDLLSSAGATAGIIIAGMIFLQFLSSKYTELCGRYRELAVEYRDCCEDKPRHGPLQSEIRMYRRRLSLMNRASAVAAIALMCFLLAVLAGGVSILVPRWIYFKYLGTAGLLAGLVLVASAVLIEIYEIILARHELHEETADLDDHARGL